MQYQSTRAIAECYKQAEAVTSNFPYKKRRSANNDLEAS